jgi:hypothetical protein
MSRLASPGATLQLRDIHQAPPPSWWPPALGWWLLAAIVLLVIGAIAWRLWRRRQRARALSRLFDDALARAATPQAQVAAMSELLRRAARNIDPGADALPGDKWLAFLDRSLPSPVFVGRLGDVLLEGGFRRSISQDDADALRVAARARFLDWMAAR